MLVGKEQNDFEGCTLSVVSCAYKRKTRCSSGHGGLVVRSRPRDLRVAGWEPDSTEDPPCMGPVTCQSIPSGQTSSRWSGAEAWRGGASPGVVLVI
ncbi:hypothetical protein AVEN_56036-1 [Araneus ventricosus]|uniref:Uncharacterized protein n=1 Tax=Araneus ventricosus TaxID=182803 RepID=A0A4Y2DNG1_ARAVE|nr:hypothetical protein AVEN_56036-1 [Araneus ventricosus]